MSELADIRLLILDFDGCLTSNDVWTFADGSEAVRSWRGDGIGIKAVQRLGVRVVVVSTEVNPIVSVRCAKLGVEVLQGVTDKAAAVTVLAGQSGQSDLKDGATLAATAFLGNDINDIPALDIVGHPWVVKDAHPKVQRRRNGELYHRLRFCGGYGAVRELCDMIVEAKLSALVEVNLGKATAD